MAGIAKPYNIKRDTAIRGLRDAFESKQGKTRNDKIVKAVSKLWCFFVSGSPKEKMADSIMAEGKGSAEVFLEATELLSLLEKALHSSRGVTATKEDIEKQLALGLNKKEAAIALNIGRSTLYKILSS